MSMFADFPKEAAGVLAELTDTTKPNPARETVLHAAHEILSFAKKHAIEIGTHIFHGDHTVPADHSAQLSTFSISGLWDHIPSWLIKLCLKLVADYLLGF